MRLLCIVLAALALVERVGLPVAADTLQTGQAQLRMIESLTGTWDAPTKNGTMTDIFQPFGDGTAVLGEELMNGKQITATIFYVVDGQLYADHYCDYKNQPRYTALPSIDPSVIDFELRDATNIDTYPIFFHSTVWKVIDTDHLVQDWYVQGGKIPNHLMRMQFTRRKEK